MPRQKKPKNIASIYQKFFEATGFKNDQELKDAFNEDILGTNDKVMAIAINRADYEWYNKLGLSTEEDLYVVDKWQTYIGKKLGY